MKRIGCIYYGVVRPTRICEADLDLLKKEWIVQHSIDFLSEVNCPKCLVAWDILVEAGAVDFQLAARAP